MFGCETPLMQPHIFPGDEPKFTCHLRFFRDNPGIEGTAFNLHLHWSHGILPAPGGIDDQAADFSLVVASVEYGVQAGRARLQEVEQREAKRKTDGGKRPSKGGRR